MELLDETTETTLGITIMKKVFYGWWIVLSCFFISLFVGAVVFFGFTAFFEPIREEFGWSYTQISLAASLRGLEMGIFAPIAGVLVDRFGSRKLILWGMITLGIGFVLLGFTRALAMFYTCFVLIAFGAGGCTSVVTMTVVANWFQKNIGMALGIMASGFGAGGLIVPFIVRLIDSYGWRATVVLLGVGMWTLGIPLSFVIRNKPEQYGYLPDGEVPTVQHPTPEAQNQGKKTGLKEILKNQSFLCLNVVEIIRMITTTAVITHIMPYLSSLGIPRPTAALVAAAIPLSSIIGRFGFGWLGDFVDKRYMQALAFACLGTGMFAFCYIKVTGVLFVFLLLFPTGFGGSMVLRGSIIREYFGRDSFGKLIGIVMGSASIGGIIGPTLAGWIFDILGSYRSIWFVFAGLIGLAVFLALRMKPVTP